MTRLTQDDKQQIREEMQRNGICEPDINRAVEAIEKLRGQGGTGHAALDA